VAALERYIEAQQALNRPLLPGSAALSPVDGK
jgi:hypothetical protein